MARARAASVRLNVLILSAEDRLAGRIVVVRYVPSLIDGPWFTGDALMTSHPLIRVTLTYAWECPTAERKGHTMRPTRTNNRGTIMSPTEKGAVSRRALGGTIAGSSV